MKRDWMPRNDGPAPRIGREIARKIEQGLAEINRAGSYWLCLNCSGVNTREEDDHGQPHYCRTCGSHRLQLVQQVPEVLEPLDLYD